MLQCSVSGKASKAKSKPQSQASIDPQPGGRAEPPSGLMTSLYVPLGELKSSIESVEAELSALQAQVYGMGCAVGHSGGPQRLAVVRQRINDLFHAEGPVEFLAEQFDVQLEPRLGTSGRQSDGVLTSGDGSSDITENRKPEPVDIEARISKIISSAGPRLEGLNKFQQERFLTSTNRAKWFSENELSLLYMNNKVRIFRSKPYAAELEPVGVEIYIYGQRVRAIVDPLLPRSLVALGIVNTNSRLKPIRTLTYPPEEQGQNNKRAIFILNWVSTHQPTSKRRERFAFNFRHSFIRCTVECFVVDQWTPVSPLIVLGADWFNLHGAEINRTTGRLTFRSPGGDMGTTSCNTRVDQFVEWLR